MDPRRVGLAGHSQAGWIMPLAASREPPIRFLVSFSGPAVTADENDPFQNLTGEGEHPAAMTDARSTRRCARRGRERGRPGAVDSRAPHPVALGVRRARPAHPAAPLGRATGADPRADRITIAGFPNANHALVETRTGLTAEMLLSESFAPGLFPRVGAWLRAHGLFGG